MQLTKTYADRIPQRASTVNQLKAIPRELYSYPQWVNWHQSETKKWPFSPNKAYAMADVTKPNTWGGFSDAVRGCSNDYFNGIGFVFTKDSPYSFIDLDHCIIDGKIDSQAQEVMNRFPRAYTEVSPSGNGLKIVLKGKLPDGNRRIQGLEAYDRLRYSTLTGQALIVPDRLDDYTAELTVWYYETFPATTSPTEEDDERDLQLSPAMRDRDVRLWVLRRAEVKALWYGDISRYDHDDSRADMALARHIAFFTQDAEQVERVMRKSGLARDKWDTHPTYLQRTIQVVIASLTETYQPRQDRSIIAPLQLNPAGRPIEEVRTQVFDDIGRWLDEKPNGVTLINAPCGVGKSSMAAALGAVKNIAWFAERHDMVEQVKGLASYRHIQAPSKANCPEPQDHKVFSELGYSTWLMHRQHDCEYSHQFNEKGSAIYMNQLAQTWYVAEHDAAIVDEFNPFSWVDENVIREVDLKDLRSIDIEDAAMLVRGLQRVMLDVGKQPLYAKGLFDPLAREVDDLHGLVNRLASNEDLMQERPTPPKDWRKIQVVKMPVIVSALQRELESWLTGNDWNGCIRLEKDKIKILRPRRINGGKPTMVLDATGDAEIMSLLLGQQVEVWRYEVQPPKNMQHIAVRTGRKGYTKYDLIGKPSHEREVSRLIKEVRHVLSMKDVRDMHDVGLITFHGLEDRLRTELGILKKHTGHFYGVRGSNAFEECAVLIVAGTPCPNLDDIVWLARMLYRDDPTPIDTGMNNRRYIDVRLNRLIEYLIRAELTQVCHRNRPLANEDRTVISFCRSDIDFLPATETITQIPNLK